MNPDLPQNDVDLPSAMLLRRFPRASRGGWGAALRTDAAERALPRAVRIVEVGPRDGLQNEPTFVPTDAKLAFVAALRAAGLAHIEAASFVSPKWVPQMRDAEAVMAGLAPLAAADGGVTFSALTPNMRGFERAAALPATGEVAVFVAASEAFSRRNTNCSRDEALARAEPVARAARGAGVRLRGYVSTVLGCPYEGAVAPAAVAAAVRRLLDMGCAEVSLGDTIGAGTPRATAALLRHLVDGDGGAPPAARPDQLAAHFHDTHGCALANLLVALEFGVATVDAAAGGLGGCPYAPGAAGNVATEDVVHMLDGMGIATGVDLDRLVDAVAVADDALARPPGAGSKTAAAVRARRQRAAAAGAAA